jgi:pyridinium-3,5-bisthiocarboxylic acid mononucleotide nickel chelatase
MKVLCYDCFSGISGDMNLGAMIDLGIDRSFLIKELNKLNVKGWKLVAEKDQRHGITGTKVTVVQTNVEIKERNLSDIERIINESVLDAETKKLSRKIFMKVAEAEASVHGISPAKVHFHEVGALDSIIDIVGAAICFNALGVDAVFVSTVELGSGFVICDHGKLPVPAPATAEIIKGIPVRKGGVDFEATTPTGAAILAALGTHFGELPAFRTEKTGYGIGTKDHPNIPNLLRVFLGETEDTSSGHDALLLECNIDDMNPEFFEHVSEKLFDAGASDVFISAALMKKGRPGNILSVICEKGLADILREIIFMESTTLGIRTLTFRKDTLSRKFEILKTIFGNVTIKRSFYKGKEVSFKPEYEECRKIAMERGLPVKEVYNTIMGQLYKGDRLPIAPDSYRDGTVTGEKQSQSENNDGDQTN